MRPILWLTLLIGFAAFFIDRHGGELRKAAGLIVRGDPRWVLAMIATQVMSLALVTGKWRMLLARVGAQLPAQTVLGAYLRRHLISTVLPIGGPAGLVHFMRDLGKHRVSSGTILHASMLASLVNQAALALYLITALGWLAIAGRATGTMLIAAILMTALVLACTAAFSFVLKRGELPQALNKRLPAKVTKPIADIRANGFRLRDIATALPFAIMVNIASIALLAGALMVVGQHPALTIILSARVAATISGMMLPVMQGGGAVEALPGRRAPRRRRSAAGGGGRHGPLPHRPGLDPDRPRRRRDDAVGPPCGDLRPTRPGPPQPGHRPAGRHPANRRRRRRLLHAPLTGSLVVLVFGFSVFGFRFSVFGFRFSVFGKELTGYRLLTTVC